MDEFDLIDRYFRPLGERDENVALGIGDDAALIDVPPGKQIVVTTDTQVEVVHFPAGADPAMVAYRSCAAALSDIAAMGAEARWLSLALTMPHADANWLQGFAAGIVDVVQAREIAGDLLDFLQRQHIPLARTENGIHVEAHLAATIAERGYEENHVARRLPVQVASEGRGVASSPIPRRSPAQRCGAR